MSRRSAGQGGRPRLRRRSSTLLGPALLLAALAVLAGPTPLAGAHAGLVATDPENGARLDAPIDDATFTFSEPVKPRGFTLVDESGRRTELDAEAEGDDVVVAVDTDGGGWFALSWSVVSTDGHPISGAITFRVGEGSAEAPADLARAATDGEVSDGSDLPLTVGRALALLGLMVATGAAFLRSRVLADDVQPVRRVALVAAGLGALGAVVAVVASFVADLVVWPGTGAEIAVGAASIVVMAWALSPRDDERMATMSTVVGLAALATVALGGHVAGDARVVTRVALVAHLLAATVWLGATPALAVALRAGAGWEELKRFSRSAIVTTAVVAVGGAVTAWMLADGVSSFTGTTWGRLLIAKVALVVVAVVLGALNRRWVGRRAHAPRVGQLVSAEAALLVAVLILTAALARSSPSAAEVPDPGLQEVRIALGEVTAQVLVEPATGNARQVHLSFLDDSGRLADVRAATLELSAEERGVSPIPQELTKISDGHYVTTTDDLRLSGDWTAHVTALLGSLDSAEGDAEFTL